MQETRNNCFGSKIRSTNAEMLRSTTLRQAKTGKHECRNVHYISTLVLTCFRLTNGRAAFFRPETIIVSFLHLTMLFFQSDIQSILYTFFCNNIKVIQDMKEKIINIMYLFGPSKSVL